MDADEKFVYIRDVKRNQTLPSIIYIKGDRLIFSITSRLNKSEPRYDLIVCNYKLVGNGTCQITLSLVAMESGGGSLGKQYSAVGGKMDIQYHNLNHSTIFYTSQYESKLQNSTLANFTFINTLQLFSLESNGVKQYKNYTTTNHLRQKSLDEMGKGSLQFGVHGNNLLASYQKLDKLYFMPVCSFNQSLGTFNCIQCPPDNFAADFNSQICSSCLTTYATNSFQNLLKLLYCNNQPVYNSSNYPYQNQRVIQSFQLYQGVQDKQPSNTIIDDFIPYPDGYTPPIPTPTPTSPANNTNTNNTSNSGNSTTNNTQQTNQTNTTSNQTNTNSSNSTDQQSNQTSNNTNSNTNQTQTNQTNNDNQNSTQNNQTQQTNQTQQNNQSNSGSQNQSQTNQTSNNQNNETSTINNQQQSVKNADLDQTVITCKLLRKYKKAKVLQVKELQKVPVTSAATQQTQQDKERHNETIKKQNNSKIILKNMRINSQDTNISKKKVKFTNESDHNNLSNIFRQARMRGTPSTASKFLADNDFETSRRLNDIELQLPFQQPIFHDDNDLDNPYENSSGEYKYQKQGKEESGIIFQGKFDPEEDEKDVLTNRLKCVICEELLEIKDLISMSPSCSHKNPQNVHKFCMQSLKSSPSKKTECYKCSNTQSGPHMITQSTPSSIDQD
eukprot:403376469